jgi:uncharacterized protein
MQSLVLCSTAAVAADFQVPRLTGPVVDQAQILPGRSMLALESIIRAFAQNGRAQIQVLTVSSLGGLEVEQASIQVVDAWRPGTKANDNGVLILIAPNERKVRIEVGQGLEGDLPDAYASRIIDRMKPFFKEGRYGDGAIVGVAEVARRLDPNFKLNQELGDNVPRARRSTNSGSGALGLIFMIVVFLILSRFGGPRGGGGAGFVTGLLLGSMSRGGGRSGGGGWSGGGGGFSGGGSSGSW